MGVYFFQALLDALFNLVLPFGVAGVIAHCVDLVS